MHIKTTIPEDCSGSRLDKALAMVLRDYSRTTIQTWLDTGQVLLDGVAPVRRTVVAGGETVEIRVPEIKALDFEPEDIPIEVVFEDDAVIVVNKPAGMVVHPGAGNRHGTLLNALLQHCRALQQLPRAGIVHRLDKNTSGLLIVAKTEPVRLNLIRQFKQRAAGRKYVGIVEGRLISGGTIDAAVGRSRHNRRRMAAGVGKPAVSHYRVISRYRVHTLVRVMLETGRTHQIRVHFKHAGFPLVGDPDYGGRVKIPAGASLELTRALSGFQRQALHAAELQLDHPLTGQQRHWSLGIPEDMRTLVIALKNDSVKSR